MNNVRSVIFLYFRIYNKMCGFKIILKVISYVHFFRVIGSYDVSYSGLLKPECINQYYRIFVSKVVPNRDYLYFHEDQERKQIEAKNGAVDVNWRIIGGTQVPIEEVPYQVLYGLYCGGTLIAPEWVITAAHCRDKETFILAGSTQRSKAKKYQICAHFIHPQWNTTGLHTHDFDYQLVLLDTPVPLTPQTIPIAIGRTDDIVTGAMVSISGWGHTAYKQRQMQDIVRRVRVPVIDINVCRSLPLQNYHTTTPRMFCAGYLDGSKDSCQGDSGGPAVINNRLVGLVSFGVGCAMKNQPGVYANIPLVRPWIRLVTGLPL